MAEFSRFIRPGCQLIQTEDDDSLAAYDNKQRQLVIVDVNDQTVSRTTRFKLNGLKTTAGKALAYRTSVQEEVAPLQSIAISEGTFVATLPAGSVKTFVIPDAVLAE